ncbi:hypothetical protein HYH02_013762 [Chlamydomonas schloesseri]|uniref:Uncharacterized protein n=1 Tax=Chlamydomonas schloesseri TaxID=2026947 RepID=A0A835T1V1_9CHLO|nr:hypothetical protein HYH02_013762 [Chlamydomonas schloesseri]|eukprot:KAG2430400.1 hypothetical protein HYH02_013762 [Chlamydomonas schloesseri]
MSLSATVLKIKTQAAAPGSPKLESTKPGKLKGSVTTPHSPHPAVCVQYSFDSEDLVASFRRTGSFSDVRTSAPLCGGAQFSFDGDADTHFRPARGTHPSALMSFDGAEFTPIAAEEGPFKGHGPVSKHTFKRSDSDA